MLTQSLSEQALVTIAGWVLLKTAGSTNKLLFMLEKPR
jgi:hypothetical protein